MDSLTHFLMTRAMPDQTTDTIARNLLSIFLAYGFPKILVSDNGQALVSAVFKQMCKLLRVKTINCSPYSPQSNLIERIHLQMKIAIKSYIDKDLQNWNSLLDFATFSINTHTSESTGFSPYMLTFGKESHSPLTDRNPVPIYSFDSYLCELKHLLNTIHIQAKENMLKRRMENKKNYDKKARPLNVSVGDYVMHKNLATGSNRKFQQIYNGPYLVTKIINEHNIEIETERKKRKIVHANRLIKFKGIAPNETAAEKGTFFQLYDPPNE